MRGVAVRGVPPLPVERLVHVERIGCSAPSRKSDVVSMGILAHQCTISAPWHVNGALSILPLSSPLSVIQCTVHPTYI